MTKRAILITCDYEWEHQAEVDTQEQATTWMLEHSRGNDEYKANGDDQFRMWNFSGDAEVTETVTIKPHKS